MSPNGKRLNGKHTSPVKDGRPRWSLPRGRVLLRALRDDPTQEYLVLVPSRGAADAPVLVSVHGISRNAYEQAKVFAAACEQHRVVLLVPIFTVEQHKDYQRLGRAGRGARADLLLNRCLAEVAFLTGADVARVHLFGFSGGAQFAHRYLLAHPDRVASAVFVAAGWYTFPDHQQRYPYGIRSGRSLPGVSFNPERFLRIPVRVLVGQQDVGSSNLRKTHRVNAQQGKSRLERARNWVAAMREAAVAFGIEPNVQLTEVPDMDHSFASFQQDGVLIEQVIASLFEEGVKPRDEPAPLNEGAPDSTTLPIIGSRTSAAADAWEQ